MEGESSCFFNIKNDVNTIGVIVIVFEYTNLFWLKKNTTFLLFIFFLSNMIELNTITNFATKLVRY